MTAESCLVARQPGHGVGIFAFARISAHRARRLFAAMSAVLMLPFAVPAQHPGEVDASFDPGEGPNGAPYTILSLPNGKMLIGGTFSTFAGHPCRGLVRLNEDGSVDATFASSGGGAGTSVRALALDASGRIFVAGTFTSFNGEERQRAALLRADGSLDPSFVPKPRLAGIVEAIAVQPDGKILLGGNFSATDEIFQSNLIRLKPGGDLDLTFRTEGGLEGLKSMAVQPNGHVIVARGHQILALLDTGGPNFQFQGSAITATPGVPSVALRLLPDAGFAAVGRFVLPGVPVGSANSTLSQLVRFHSDGTRDAAFSPVAAEPAQSYFSALANDGDGRMVVAGSFSNVAGTRWQRIARFLPDGTPDHGFDPGAGIGGIVRSIAIDGRGRIIVAGSFTRVGELARPGIARLHGTAAELSAPTMVEDAPDLTVDEGQPAALFSRVRGAPSPTVQWLKDSAPLPGANRLTLSFAAATVADSGLYTLAASNSLGSALGRVVKVTVRPAPKSPGSVDPWYRPLPPPSSVLMTAGSRDGKLTVLHGDQFTISRHNPDGSPDSTFTAQRANNANFILLQPDGKLLASGPVGLNRFNADGTLDPSFENFFSEESPSVMGANARAMAVDEQGRIWVGKLISFRNGVRQPALWRFLPNGVIDLSFQNQAFTNSAVDEIVIQRDGRAIAGSVALTDFRRLVRVHEDGAIDGAFHATLTGNLAAAELQGDGKILAAGRLYLGAEGSSLSLVRLWPDGLPDAGFSKVIASPPDYLIDDIALLPDGKIVVAGRFNAINGTPRGDIARLNPDGSVDPTFDAGTSSRQRILSVIPLPGGDILAHGTFLDWNGFPIAAVARLKTEPFHRIEQPVLEQADFRFLFTTPAGKKAALEETGSLAAPSWSPFLDFPGTGKPEVFSVPRNSQGSRFYRFRVE